MNTIEASYVMGITLIVIASLVIGGIRLHETVTGTMKTQLRTEVAAHQKDGEKRFKPEAFMRMVTLLEKGDEG